MDCSPYVSAVGTLMYTIVCTILDISQVVEVLSCFMDNIGHEHWDKMKRVL
jgi:hypothetical protein